MRLLIFFNAFLCFSISVAQDIDYQFLSIPKTLTQHANAVVRLNESIVNIQSRELMVVKRKKVVTVLNSKGDQYALMYVGYDKGKKVKDIQAVVYDEFGNEQEKIKENRFRDVSAVDGGTLYSDSRVKYFPFTPIDYPYTIEVTSEVVTKNTGEIIPYWSFLEDFMVSTEKSRLVINVASLDMKPTFKEKNFGEYDIEKKELPNSIVYQATNLAAIAEESPCPSFNKVAPGILIRPIKFNYEGYEAEINNWNDLGLWMHENLLKGRDELTSASVQKANSLVENITDDLEKAKIIYKYVQENTRYISVQVGIGGIQPISAIEVGRLKYGDCKGLSNYTKALLKAVGVEAFYTHVEAGSQRVDFEEDFPDLAQGNHVILAIPYKGAYYWIDCTSQTHPFGFVGRFTDGRKVLVIKPNGGELVRTVSYNNSENYQKTIATYRLSANGGIIGKVTRQTKGTQYDSHFRIKDQTKEVITDYYKKNWDNINNLVIDHYEFENNTDDVEFDEKIGLSAVDYASKTNNRLLFSPNAFNRITTVPKRYRNRKLPFDIQRGFLDEDVFEIMLPDGFEVEAIPEKIILENQFGRYSSEVEMIDNKLVLKRTFALKDGQFPKEDYAAYRDFMKVVVKNDAAKIVLKSEL
ncbi:DUF3857 domain-containing protein [Aggregatimonas sangjinii]|uniref:DUF3857 domain-containing protein n=1 Tax=Aggregatimonas sangjinii TaxID=2583587 RepID=A0A5B7SPW8_9FLAO|nr:DUF3857 domain-containing protein [Aggregatimonas sangjinii]QCW99020.1 DUF3857 domain-containing protein [Aggregatimonas sangjinii]